MKKIFISSTRRDLEEERGEIIRYVDSLPDCKAIAMEKFSASKDRSKEQCLTELEHCNALILLIGFKYGSIDEEEGISFTEFEFNAAKKIGKAYMPIFVFVKTKNGEWNADEQDKDLYEKLNSFKSRLDNEIGWAAFETLVDLIGKVSLTLYNERIERESIETRLNLLIPYEEFFKPFLNKDNYFNHTYQFVGRENNIENLNNFISKDEKILIIQGRGGIGKSRILFEFSRCFKEYNEEWELFFLNEQIITSKENFPQLKPHDKFIIVIDDAHRINNQELLLLFNVLHKYPHSKIILSCRPYGFDYIKTVLNRAGVDPQEIYNTFEIEEMGSEDLEKLGLEVLGEKYKHLIKSLIQVADNSPLVIVVGGNLIKEKKIRPILLERQREFHDVVFNRFEDELIGKISNEIDKHLYKDILSLISSLSPINTDEEFFGRASKFLNIESYELIRIIDLMETTGILIRRGNSVKITPDVLSDHILHNTCLTTRGQSTGYANRVFQVFWDYSPQNLLLNLSELDWRVKQVVESDNLLSEIWVEIENNFKESSISRRQKILGYIERVAIFQPARALNIVELTINFTSEGLDDKESISNSQLTPNTVLYRLPPILENISHHLEYLTRCCEILWKLGKNDRRQFNNHPSHPMRVLSNLAKYERYKDLLFNSTILDFVENCFKDPKNHEYYNSLFDILDKLLSKEETDEEYEDHQITFYPFSVSYENTKFIRERALVLLSDSAKIETTKTKLRVFKSLYDVLWPPTGHHNRKVSENELDQWMPEIVEVLRIIENLVKTSKDPIVLIQVDSDLRRVSRALKEEQCRITDNIISLIPDSLDLKITRALWDEYDKYDRDIEIDYFEMLEKIESIKKQLTFELLKKCKDIERLIDYLEKKLDDLEKSGVQYNSDGFFIALSIADYKVAQEICQYIISNPGSILTTYFSALMYGIRLRDVEKTIELSRFALETNNKKIIYSLAQGYGRKPWSKSIDKDDIDIIKKLINHPDESIKNVAIRSLVILPDKWHQLAIRLALKVDIGDNQELANSLCFIFEKNRIKIENVRYLDINSILDKLVPINDIKHGAHYIPEFIRHCSSRYPHLIINFFFDRILYSKTKESSFHNRYEPLPNELRHEIEFEKHPNFIGILRKIRNKILDPDYRNFYISELFLEISDNFSPDSLKVLCEWIKSENIKKIEAVGSLISIAIRYVTQKPSDFVFSNLNVVKELLDNSYALNKDSYVKIRDRLIDAHFRVRMRYNLSEDSEDDIIIRRSKKILKELPEKSPTREFYYLLCKRANEFNNQIVFEDDFD